MDTIVAVIKKTDGTDDDDISDDIRSKKAAATNTKITTMGTFRFIAFATFQFGVFLFKSVIVKVS